VAQRVPWRPRRDSAMLRPAREIRRHDVCTESVRSFHVPATPRTSAGAQLPSRATSRATRVTVRRRTSDWSTIVFTTFAVRRTPSQRPALDRVPSSATVALRTLADDPPIPWVGCTEVGDKLFNAS